jgi:hypothetical protein
MKLDNEVLSLILAVISFGACAVLGLLNSSQSKCVKHRANFLAAFANRFLAPVGKH